MAVSTETVGVTQNLRVFLGERAPSQESDYKLEEPGCWVGHKSFGYLQYQLRPLSRGPEARLSKKELRHRHLLLCRHFAANSVLQCERRKSRRRLFSCNNNSSRHTTEYKNGVCTKCSCIHNRTPLENIFNVVNRLTTL